MPPTTNPIRLQGFTELSRAFALADKALQTGFRKGLRDAVEPIKSDAEILAGTSIRNMGAPGEGSQDWRRMRVGITKTSVYVAPRSRAPKGKRSRRNLFDLIAGRSLEPALEDNISDVTERVDDVLGFVGQVWDRA